ncbi:MAG: M23 family metallopeptidase [Pseudomonadota bacterium]
MTAAYAGDLYRYQDEQGNWHFSDKPPATGEATRQTLGRETLSPSVELQRVDAQSVALKNGFSIPVQVLVVASSGERFVTVVGALETETVSIEGVSADATLEHAYQLGDPEAEHQPPRPYRVPFAAASRQRVSQGFNGGITHLDPSSTYAVDIAMPIGTGIMAAREGVVVEIAYANFAGLADAPTRPPPANLVRIGHDDGTYAIYVHLDRASVRVRPGQRVRRGELIAASGNTGFSTGPHLHFAILRNAGGEAVSVPFVFEGTAGKPVVPEQGAWLTAYP